MGVAGGAVVVGVTGRATADIELILGFGAGHIGTGFGAIAGISSALCGRLSVWFGGGCGIGFDRRFGGSGFGGWSNTR